MKKSLTIILTALVLTLSLGLAGAFADVRGNLKGTEIIGAKVENRQGENLGKISDLAVDLSSGRVDFAVLSHGGALGIGDRYIGIPLNAFTWEADKNGKVDKLVLNMSKDKLAQAPNFTKDAWPDRSEMEKTYRYFGQTPYWTETQSQKAMEPKHEMKAQAERTMEPKHDMKTQTQAERTMEPKREAMEPKSEMKYASTSGSFKGSNIIGAKVENLQGETLGKITDLAVDSKTGRIDFAVLAHGGSMGIGDKYTAVPTNAFSVKTDKDGKFDRLVLDISKDKLAKAPSFDGNKWPNGQEAETYYRYFGQSPSWGEHHGQSHKVK